MGGRSVGDQSFLTGTVARNVLEMLLSATSAFLLSPPTHHCMNNLHNTFCLFLVHLRKTIGLNVVSIKRRSLKPQSCVCVCVCVCVHMCVCLCMYMYVACVCACACAYACACACVCG